MTVACNVHAGDCYIGEVKAHISNRYILFATFYAQRDRLPDWFVKGPVNGAPLLGDLALWRPPVSIKNHVAVGTGWGDLVTQSGFVLANPTVVQDLAKTFQLQDQARASANPAVQKQAQAAREFIANLPHSRNFTLLSDLRHIYGNYELWRLKSRGWLDPTGPLEMFLMLSQPSLPVATRAPFR